MANPITMKDILALSPAERIQLVEDIWDSLAEFPEAITLTEAQRQLLDERLKAHRADPKAGSPWPEVKARILGKA
jgi:putative addiction module component (TIGR02574 family)